MPISDLNATVQVASVTEDSDRYLNVKSIKRNLDIKSCRLLQSKFFIKNSNLFCNSLQLNFLFVYLLLIICYATSVSGLHKIPGCYDIDHIDEVINLNDTSLQNLLLCFCKVKSESNVVISCLYGSTLDDLQKAISLVNDLNGTVEEVILSHMDFTDYNITENFFNRKGVQLKRLLIGSCTQESRLEIENGAFNGVERSLEELELVDCHIDEFPEAISVLINLRSLSLANNRLITINKTLLTRLKKLQSLNLAGNFIATLEEGIFEPFSDTLETLSFGEHNFINESFFNEIIKLRNLKTLDLGKADGITYIPNETFQHLRTLEKLVLTGCSLKRIDESTFKGLENLRELDLRVNLIQQIACNSFKDMAHLQRLSLAGNFLNKTKSCFWNDLRSLTELDLGWNEFQTIENSFSNIAPTLKTLDLRHNTNLETIEPNAFKNLKLLETLNLSDTAIANINQNMFEPLTGLKALDLANSQVDFIEPHSFHAQNNSLKKLVIRNTKLRRISPEIIQELDKLEQLDLSLNKWLCDIKITPVIRAIKKKYENAARRGQKFILENANETVCDRPYAQRGEIITSLNESTLKAYDIELDTTTITGKQTTTTQSTSEESTFAFTLLPKEEIIGDENNTITKGHEQTEMRSPPEYEINSSRPLGEKSQKTNLLATIIALGVLVAITTIIMIAIAFHIQQKKRIAAMIEAEMDVRFKKEEQEKDGFPIQN